jgi:hypothetical protein
MIDRFRGEHAFLSNFHPAPVTVAGITFPTVEHAYQAAKISLDVPQTERREMQRAVALLRTPGLAKRWGRHVTLRSGWLENRVALMQRLLGLKFIDPILIGGLWDTEPHELVEGNDWGDTFWGMCRGKGENRLGRLLMEIRGS